MALATKISNAAAIAACNAVVDLIDDGTPVGYVEIRSGTQPASVDDTAAGTCLATIPYNDPAFGAAADAAPGGQAAADVTPALQDTSADASGTAAWFRVYSGAGAAIIDGSCGTSGCDMNLDNTSIAAGQTVTLTSHTVKMPES